MGLVEEAKKFGIDLREFTITGEGLKPVGGGDIRGVPKVKLDLWGRIFSCDGTGSGYRAKKLPTINKNKRLP